MKKVYFVLFSLALLGSCKPVVYTGSYNHINQTQVVLSEANFNVLGSFRGIATEKSAKFSIKDKEGIIYLAKRNLLDNASVVGVDLKGSRTMVNVTVDLIENKNRLTATISADIIEFTK